ncbi:MAG: PadR family transcriptional regulator [Anaerovoracaceae bacterium]|jgi:PadR family transcriptional regulator PadR
MSGISSDVMRGYNDTIILYLLLQEPSYGYAISKQIRLISEEKYIIKETTLYSAFTRMERNGYIESFYRDDTASGGKRRTYYRITERGRAYYCEKCREWNLTRDVISRFIDEAAKEGDALPPGEEATENQALPPGEEATKEGDALPPGAAAKESSTAETEPASGRTARRRK